MAKFAGRRGDLKWGRHDYPVTQTQKVSLDALLNLMSGLPRAYNQPDLWEHGFCSQNAGHGGVIFGVNHQSVTVGRDGRLYSNQ